MNSNTLFFIFSFFLVISASLVTLSKHSIFSLLFLISCFLLASFILFLLECEFLALIFIVVYLGAIAVFFLFAIMMLESKFINLSRNTLRDLLISFIFSVSLFLPFLNEIPKYFGGDFFLDPYDLNKRQNWYQYPDYVTDVEVYGSVLYSYYVVHFLVAGLILMLVLIGIVYLTNTFNHKETLEQFDFKQLSRHSKFFLKD